MGERVRWSLRVSHETGAALRALLATRGGRRGGLSQCVEEAVNRDVLRLTVNQLRSRNAGVSEGEITRLVDDELSAIRTASRAHARR